MVENIDELFSTTKIAKELNISRDELFEKLAKYGWIKKSDKYWELLEKGLKKGGKYYENEKSERWIVWPISIISDTVIQSEFSSNIQVIEQKESTKVRTERKFKLPGVQELNKDQDKVLRLPEDGQFLIVGGPGTGKSVVALLRALKYHEKNDYQFLVYNHVLNSATNQLIDIRLNSSTLKAWFYSIFYQLTNEYVPQVKEYTPNYDEIIKKFQSMDIKTKTLHLIIDEGQDMPPKFYEALMYTGVENFFIVADQNQQITKEHSSRQELTNQLGLDTKDVIELNENYRNSNPIAMFAQYFFTDPSSPKPNLPPESKRSFGIPILYEYSDIDENIIFILRQADSDPRNLIAIITATDAQREIYYERLQTKDINLDNPRSGISTYSNKSKASVDIDFSIGGIVVLNDTSVKGLEFDIVFIVIDGFKIYNNDTDSMKKRFYVMSSRAIKKLVLLKSIDNNTYDILNILPNDENILKRETTDNG